MPLKTTRYVLWIFITVTTITTVTLMAIRDSLIQYWASGIRKAESWTQIRLFPDRKEDIGPGYLERRWEKGIRERESGFRIAERGILAPDSGFQQRNAVAWVKMPCMDYEMEFRNGY